MVLVCFDFGGRLLFLLRSVRFGVSVFAYYFAPLRPDIIVRKFKSFACVFACRFAICNCRLLSVYIFALVAPVFAFLQHSFQIRVLDFRFGVSLGYSTHFVRLLVFFCVCVCVCVCVRA